MCPSRRCTTSVRLPVWLGEGPVPVVSSHRCGSDAESDWRRKACISADGREIRPYPRYPGHGGKGDPSFVLTAPRAQPNVLQTDTLRSVF